MAEIIINDVKYTNVPNKKAGTKFASALTQSNIGMSQAVQDYVNSSYFYALINAIDINWDGIDIGENSYINTTSDLIKWIETKAGDIDLSSYATVTYVNQKIEDLVGAAPETLDTLEEIAAALQNDATLSYVTEALSSKANTTDVYDKTTVDNMIGGLDSTYASISYVTTELEKKADLSDIPSAPDLTPYVTYTQANSYYAGKNEIPDMTDYATVSYVTSELENKADISDIPSAPDLTPYVTYTQANSYYVDLNSNQTINGTKRFNSNITINGFIPQLEFSQDNHQVGSINYAVIYIDGTAEYVMKLGGSYKTVAFNNGANDFYIPTRSHFNTYFPSNVSYCLPIAFKDNNNNYITANKYGLVDLSTLIPSTPDLTPYVTYTQANSYYAGKNEIPDMTDYATVSYVTTELENKADISDIPSAPDLTPYVTYADANTYYVDVTSYNTLYAEVQHLAYLISYYHPEPTPEPSLLTPSAKWSNTHNTGTTMDENVPDNESVLAVQVGGQPVTCTFDGTPETGWTITQNGLDNSTASVTLNGLNITVDPSMASTTKGMKRLVVSRDADSSYSAGTAYFKLRVLSDIEDTNFFWNAKEQNIPVGQSKFVRVYNYYASGNIQFTSDDPNITVVGGRDNDGYYGATITSSGAANAAITATLYDTNNNVLTTATIIITSSAPSLLTPTVDWIDSNTQMSVGSGIDLYKSDLAVSLTFNGTPSTGWTFTDPAGLTGIVQSDGAIYVDPQSLGEGTYSVGVYYPGDSTYDTLNTLFEITIIDNQYPDPGPDPGPDPIVPEEPATVDDWYIDGTTVASNQATYTEDDSTSHVLTFSTTPADSWTITDPNVSGVVVDNVNLTVTFTPSLMPTGQCNINVERDNDGAYDYGMGTFTINIDDGGDL